MNHFGRVLPNRKHIVLTKNKEFKYDDPNVKIVTDIKDLEKYIDSDEENFVIGGGAIYNMLLPYAKKIYITKIDEEFDGDTFFPEIDEKIWNIEKREKGLTDEKNPYKYEYFTYIKKEKC